MARRRSLASLPSAVTYSPTARTPLLRLSPMRWTPWRAPLSLLEDRRRYHPAGPLRRPLALPQRAAQVVVRRNRSFRYPDVLRFEAPRRVVMCVRRKERREVIFAKRKFSGSGSPKHRNYWSSISCR